MQLVYIVAESEKDPTTLFPSSLPFCCVCLGSVAGSRRRLSSLLSPERGGREERGIASGGKKKKKKKKSGGASPPFVEL